MEHSGGQSIYLAFLSDLRLMCHVYLMRTCSARFQMEHSGDQ